MTLRRKSPVASALLRFALAAAAFVIALAAASTARAAGTVKAEKTTIQEVEGQWKVKLQIDYGSMPEMAFIATNFSFEQVVLYERALTDESGDKPVVNKKQLQNQPPTVIPMEIGFGDGSGKIFKTTNYNFNLRRDRGFEAGEYILIIKKADGGQQLGQKIRLTLNGDNPVINRKSISFGDDKGKVESDPNKVKSKSVEEQKDIEREKAENAAAGDGSGSSSDSSSSSSSGDAPPAVEPKQGGCGCRVDATEAPVRLPWVAAGLLVSAFGARRLRRRVGHTAPL